MPTRPGLGILLLGLGLVSCGPPQASGPARGLEDLDAPAPREILFAGAYENRVSEPYAPLVRPTAVAVLPDGSFQFADYGTGKIHVFDEEGYYVAEADLGGGDASPLDLQTFGFRVYVLDVVSRSILRFTEDGVFRDVLLPLQTLDPVQRIDPSAFAVDRDGRIAVCDVAGHRVLVTGPFLDLETEIGDYGSFAGQLNEPRGVAFGQGGVLYVSERGNRRVQVFDRTGHVIGTTKAMGGVDSTFVAPSGLATDRFGNLYVADTGRGVVVVMAPDLFVLSVLGEDEMADDHLMAPVDCAVGPDDRLYVVDAGRQAVLVYDLQFP